MNNSNGTTGSSSTSPSLKPPPKPMNVSNSSKVNSSNISSIDELEDFAMGRMPNNASRKANTSTTEIKQRSGAKTNKDKGSPVARVNQSNNMDDLESFFNMGSRSSSVPKSRAATMLKAVADMNQRDLQSKMEQEERRRIADNVDHQIKRWVTGKEGNMRALLSTLQHTDVHS
ncbi:Chaperone J-domain superfamily [Sesbania bispinosa]|nr:Chaperone J-domain superfamily [Sesbania bispinosa]